jgi:hypothetical protein
MRSSYAVQVVLEQYKGLRPHEIASALRYRTFVSVAKRYMYVEVPKAACTAMKWLLHGLENGPAPLKFSLYETRRDMFIHARENVPLPSLVDLDNETQKYILESPDVLRMTVVRNPYTRTVSTWRNKVLLCEPGGFDRVYIETKGRAPEPGTKSMISLHEFARYLATDRNLTSSTHWSPQTDHTFFRAFRYSHVGRTEHLAETLRRFQDHLGRAEPLEFERRNASMPLGHVAYDSELAALISQLYQQDFETFDYDPNVWPFDQQADIGAATISEATYRNEIIERNMIITHLSWECARLERLYRRSTRKRQRVNRALKNADQRGVLRPQRR